MQETDAEASDRGQQALDEFYYILEQVPITLK
jgi:hypothetical protein